VQNVGYCHPLGKVLEKQAARGARLGSGGSNNGGVGQSQGSKRTHELLGRRGRAEALIPMSVAIGAGLISLAGLFIMSGVLGGVSVDSSSFIRVTGSGEHRSSARFGL
jgi:hypothetical protein